jgi:lysophospholipase L1-like esterase
VRLRHCVYLLCVLVLAAGPAEAAAKRVMVYGDSNTWGWIPVEKGVPSTRYAEGERWPGVLRATLGGDYEVIEEGLNARTTDVPDPTLPRVTGAGVDGGAYLPAALASHLPLDLVVILLGTNDLKAMFDRSPLRIALGAAKLVDIVETTDGGVGTTYPDPKVLLLAPPPLGEMGFFREMFAGGAEKSRQLAPYYEAVAKVAGAEFLDLGGVTKTDGVDGLHFSAEGQRKIGLAVADKVRAILH